MTIRLVKIEQTCTACPSQWDAWDEDGEYYYIRYRWGYLYVCKGEVMGPFVWEGSIGDGLDGFMTTEEMLAHTGMELING